MRKKPPAFPAGLYGMLLFALCWLTLPGVFEPIERVLVGGACVVPRSWSAVFGEPAQAAAPDVQRQLAELGGALAARVRAHDVRSTASPWPGGGEAVHCAVVEVGDRKGDRKGGGGEPCELRLDHSYAELAGCSAVVTKGDAVIGLLQRPGTGAAIDDGADDPARVVLLNHAAARPLHAAVTTPDGGTLRFVVRAAATVDPAPLAVELWDDPYRAARLDRAGLPVTTRAVAGVANEVPAGLLIGTTRIWGYARDGDGDALTLGVFVEPAFEPRALSHVVVWRDPSAATPEGARAARPAPLRLPGVAYSLPGAGHGRHLLIGANGTAAGAAVVLDGYLLGTARGLAFGSALVTSFAASRRRWSLLLLPDAPAAPPRELDGLVVHSEGDRVWLRVRRGAGAAAEPLESGHLFTGSNGPHCPAGLWIGRATPHAHESDMLQVTVPVESGPCAVEVVAAGGGA